MAKPAWSGGHASARSHGTDGDSWRSSAARCSILPKPSTDLGPHPTHLSVPGTPHTRACPCGLPSRARASSGPTARSATRDAVERKARGGHAAEQFSKSGAISKKKLVTRRSCSGDLFQNERRSECSQERVAAGGYAKGGAEHACEVGLIGEAGF